MASTPKARRSSTRSANFHTLGVELWGVPATPIHDERTLHSAAERLRALPWNSEYCAANGETGALRTSPDPYLETPTDVRHAAHRADVAPLLHRCIVQTELPWPSDDRLQQLTFNPSLTAEPTTAPGGFTPTGVDIDLKVPQEQNPTRRLRRSCARPSTTTLPSGFSINPNAADGKTTCSDADTAIGTRNGSDLPGFSKVGSLVLDSSALPTPIPGSSTSATQAG